MRTELNSGAGSPLPSAGWEGRAAHGQSRHRQTTAEVTGPAFRIGALPPRLCVFALILLLGHCLPAAAQFVINWHTIDGGGGTSTGGVYSVSGTIGQPDANQQPMTGGNYSLTGGFWALYAVQTPGAPTLAIVPAGPGLATLSWSPATGTNWVLQETLSLSPATWTNSPSAFTNHIVVRATVPAKFYRLFKP